MIRKTLIGIGVGLAAVATIAAGTGIALHALHMHEKREQKERNTRVRECNWICGPRGARALVEFDGAAWCSCGDGAGTFVP